MDIATTLGTGVRLAPTPRTAVLRDGTATLLHFLPPDGVTKTDHAPLLLVPSLINRWYVLDLREGASLAAASVAQGLDTWLLDWGIPEDEDRHLTWDDVLERLGQMLRRIKRETGASKVSLLGYCIGGTLSTIYAARRPQDVAALVNLAGPIDFSKGGLLRTLVDAEWFDPRAVTAAGNVGASQMQQGFTALRPTLQTGKWVGLADRWHDPKARESFDALETWSSDNIPFPAAAYVTYIEQLYQRNGLIDGTHVAMGGRVDLAAIDAPLLTVVANRDTICPPDAAIALESRVNSVVKETLVVPGGHVGAVVGGKAQKVLYPAICGWLRRNT